MNNKLARLSQLHYAHGYTRHAAYFTFQGYQTKIDVTSSLWHKTFFSFIFGTNKLECFALGDTFQMGLKIRWECMPQPSPQILEKAEMFRKAQTL